MTREEEEREQAELDRKADKVVGDPVGCLAGCLPALAILVLPLLPML